VAWLGAAFLLWLGIKAFRSAWNPSGTDMSGQAEKQYGKAMRALIIVTLFNPYVWLDTVILIGGVSSVYGRHAAPSFILGSFCASLLWFSIIGFFAGKLSPLFNKPSSWRVLDGVIGLVMLATSSLLLFNFGFSAQVVQ